jgi:hypothetical protein
LLDQQDTETFFAISTPETRNEGASMAEICTEGGIKAFPGKVDLKGVHARLRGLPVFRKKMRQKET